MEATIYNSNNVLDVTKKELGLPVNGQLRIKLDYIDEDGADFQIYCGNLDKQAGIPAIMISALSSGAYRIKDLEPGEDGYLPKPFKLKLLKVGVDKLIESRDLIYKRFQDKKLRTRKTASSPMDREFLDRIMDLVDRNISNETYWVDDLSSEMNTSRSTFYRKLKKLTGQSPKDFMRKVRLQKAVHLLEEGQLRISEVAYEVGFSDPNYFSKCFRRFFGESPSNYIVSRVEVNG